MHSESVEVKKTLQFFHSRQQRDLLLHGQEIIIILLLLLLMLTMELRDRGGDLRAGVVHGAMVLLMMDTRLQLLQRDELLRFLSRRRMQELRVALCHFLRHHLLLSLPRRRASGSAKSQEIVQFWFRRRVLRQRRLLLLQLAMMPLLMMRMPLMIMENTVVHASAIACGDQRVIVLDDAAATAVRQ